MIMFAMIALATAFITIAWMFLLAPLATLITGTVLVLTYAVGMWDGHKETMKYIRR